MMWKEFEMIAGYEVTREDYKAYIEPMYMAVGDHVTKQEFVRMVNKQRFALPSPDSILRRVRKEARHLKAICGFRTDWESEERLDRAAKEYAKRKYGLDWGTDSEAFCYFLYFPNEYEYPELQRGGSYPGTLVIGRGGEEYARIKLQRS